MRPIETIKGQTLTDIAIQEYGNYEAVFEIIENNPQLAGSNDFPDSYLVDEIYDIDIAHAIKPGVKIFINDDSPLMRNDVKKELKGTIKSL